ncbi:uncharacterized protein LOC130744718 isoform X1 [Lotus japonicus]|uniref:uncharacterized protein LOC130744718 isoform X1 n=1 Tax=Lotus japonicus TaxID=34305 RepID=UPI002587A71D|nr:uncharacterized protein LOC130744718 isoform X1 [Lotus japonicus]XP_057452867.1 uncharacterized protein LOC130744718 isoform X1 [Lotus japonicus]
MSKVSKLFSMGNFFVKAYLLRFDDQLWLLVAWNLNLKLSATESQGSCRTLRVCSISARKRRIRHRALEDPNGKSSKSSSSTPRVGSPGESLACGISTTAANHLHRHSSSSTCEVQRFWSSNQEGACCKEPASEVLKVLNFFIAEECWTSLS